MQLMKKVGMRRGVRSLVLVGAIVGLATVGLATQASAIVGPGVPRSVAGFSQTVNPNNTIETTVSDMAFPGETVVVSVATGTFAGPVGCSDNTGLGNVYTVRADKNTGNGRLFVCTSTLVETLFVGNKVRATYPGFSGRSVISVIAVPNSVYSGLTLTPSTGSGSNPAVSTASIHVTEPGLLVGVVANGNVSSFTADPPWAAAPLIPVTGGTGAGQRTLTPVYRFVGPGDFTLNGALSGPGFWQAAVISLADGSV